jgi:hypothetical protein
MIARAQRRALASAKPRSSAKFWRRALLDPGAAVRQAAQRSRPASLPIRSAAHHPPRGQKPASRIRGTYLAPRPSPAILRATSAHCGSSTQVRPPTPRAVILRSPEYVGAP